MVIECHRYRLVPAYEWKEKKTSFIAVWWLNAWNMNKYYKYSVKVLVTLTCSFNSAIPIDKHGGSESFKVDCCVAISKSWKDVC
jgi:hypothetical protein